MKYLGWILSLALALPALAEEANLISQKISLVGSYITLLTKDCAKVYLIPRAYRVDGPGSTVTYLKTVRRSGAKEEVIPAVQLRLQLQPEVAMPGAAAEREILLWAGEVSPVCAGKMPKLELYPSLLIEPRAKSGLERAGIAVKNSVISPEGRLNIDLEFNPIKTSAASVINTLRFFVPELRVQAYEVEFEAYAKIDVDYSALATFADHHYTERICHTGERCWEVFGWKVKCEGYSWCDDIARMTTELKNLAYSSKAKLEVGKAQDVPERKLDQLLEELMSRFMLSAFQETSRKIAGDVIQVTLGQLKKEGGSRYKDELHTERVIEKPVVQTVLMAGDLSVFDRDLNAIFSSPEMVCLKREIKDKPIPINHKCFTR